MCLISKCKATYNAIKIRKNLERKNNIDSEDKECNRGKGEMNNTK